MQENFEYLANISKIDFLVWRFEMCKILLGLWKFPRCWEDKRHACSLQIGGSLGGLREICAENAAIASDKQPDSHCKRVFYLAGAGMGQGVVVGCGRDVTTLLPQPSLGVLNGRVARDAHTELTVLTTYITANSREQAKVYGIRSLCAWKTRSLPAQQ